MIVVITQWWAEEVRIEMKGNVDVAEVLTSKVEGSCNERAESIIVCTYP